jgi:hypothetical protein
VTKYVIAKAPCQVILTAPPASESRRPKDADGATADGDGRPASAPARR